MSRYIGKRRAGVPATDHRANLAQLIDMRETSLSLLTALEGIAEAHEKRLDVRPQPGEDQAARAAMLHASVALREAGKILGQVAGRIGEAAGAEEAIVRFQSRASRGAGAEPSMNRGLAL